MKEPVFLKQGDSVQQQLTEMKSLRETLNEEGKNLIDKDIKFLEYGVAGEKNIAFELANSHMPMYIMQDIHIEYEGLEAQIDYIIVTRKIVFFVECKNLYGNVEINSKGDFIRTVYYGNKPVREGIYSPVTQNARHLELFKKMRMDQKNKLMARAFNQFFDDNYKSVIVLANPKTIVNMKYAPREIKAKVVRADQLISYLKEECKKSTNSEYNDRQLLEQAENILHIHKEKEINYTKKYTPYVMEEKLAKDTNIAASEDSLLYERLKKYRLERSREENIKAYYIFNNEQLGELISKKPKSIEDLMNIAGFGKGKAEKYGSDIIEIITGTECESS